jgi:Zn-dependent alcohol dehydrogenase
MRDGVIRRATMILGHESAGIVEAVGAGVDIGQ